MRYFYIEPVALQKNPVSLEGSEVHHMKKALRLKPGGRICLFDGEGFEYEAIIKRFLTDRVELQVMGRRPGKTESPFRIRVAQALLKEKKMDRLLRPLCELGITQWHPFVCERSVPLPKAKRQVSRIERWEKIVKESVKQCRRARLPRVFEVKAFEDLLEFGQSCDLTIVFYENESISLNSAIKHSVPPTPRNILLILGPEGGFSEREIEQGRAAGCLIAGLGPRTLRAETATIAACSLTQYLFGDMG